MPDACVGDATGWLTIRLCDCFMEDGILCQLIQPWGLHIMLTKEVRRE